LLGQSELQTGSSQRGKVTSDSAVALLSKIEEAVRVNYLDPENPEKFKIDFDPNALPSG